MTNHSYASKGLSYYSEIMWEFEPKFIYAFACYQTISNLMKHYVDYYVPQSTTRAGVLRQPKIRDVVKALQDYVVIPDEIANNACFITEVYRILMIQSQHRHLKRIELMELREVCENVVNWFFDNLNDDMRNRLLKEFGITDVNSWAYKSVDRFKTDILNHIVMRKPWSQG